MPEQAFVALGSNLGDREAHLAQGRRGLAALPHTSMRRVTSIEETEPIGPPNQGPFLNQMVLLETELSPRQLLEGCHAIETRAARRREQRWGPRTLDVDIVIYGDSAVDEPDLIIPHPELPRRSFWRREVEELTRHVR